MHKRWVAVLTLGGVAAFMLIAYRGAVGVVLAGILLVAIVIAVRMRLVADDSGITIVNYGFPHRIPWSEIEGFRMGWSHRSNSLDVRLAHGEGARARVVTTSGGAAYSQGEADALVTELRRRLAAAHGEDPERADARALEEALRAAERRDYGPLVELALDQRVDPEELWRRVGELGDQGRIDRAEFRRALPRPPRLPWWTKVFLGSKTRELLREAEQEDTDFPA